MRSPSKYKFPAHLYDKIMYTVDDDDFSPNMRSHKKQFKAARPPRPPRDHLLLG